MCKLLIVDDEKNIRDLIVKYAKYSDFIAEEAENGRDAIEKVKNNHYDLVIMDIMMPVLDGFSAVKEIRKFSNLPVIMLSARSEEYDKLYGFDLGIDDYVTKPFSPKELMMRSHAIINRYKAANNKQNNLTPVKIGYEGLVIDTLAHLVFIDNMRIDVTNKEYEILLLLVENQGNAVTRENILEKVWGNDSNGADRTLDTHIKSLRKKIGHYSNNISTIRRVGYRFETGKN